MTVTDHIDTDRAEAFAGEMITAFNNGAVALMTSVGHRTGLFDTMSTMPPASVSEIAAQAGLQERYVREWLGAMVTGGVVEFDPTAATYRLPAEHAACLTRAAGPQNVALLMQFIGLLASVEGEVTECFRSGGGVPYSKYHEFHRLMAENSAATHDLALIDGILPLADGLTDRLSTGIDVADIGCGSGHAVNLMAATYPNSRFVGYDFSEEGIATARREAEQLGLANSRFELLDVATLDVVDAFDLVTAFDAIHDQADPAGVLAAVHRALRPGGLFLMVDIHASSNVEGNIEHPLGPFLYTVSTMHCMTVSLALDGVGLGTVWGNEVACRMLGEAGFASVEMIELDDDPLNCAYIARAE